MNLRYLTRNEECYKAPWVDLDYSLSKAFRHELIDKNSIKDAKDLEIINNGNITLSNFEHIVTTYTNFTLENILSTSYGLIDIPNYEADEVGLTFNVNGLVSNKKKKKKKKKKNTINKYIYVYVYIFIYLYIYLYKVFLIF